MSPDTASASNEDVTFVWFSGSAIHRSAISSRPCQGSPNGPMAYVASSANKASTAERSFDAHASK